MLRFYPPPPPPRKHTHAYTTPLAADTSHNTTAADMPVKGKGKDRKILAFTFRPASDRLKPCQHEAVERVHAWQVETRLA